MTLVVVGKLKHPARSLGPAVDIDYCYVGLYFWPRSFVSDLKLCDVEGGAALQRGCGRNQLVFYSDNCLQEESGRGWLVELVDHAMKR